MPLQAHKVKKNITFDTTNDISKHFTLLKLIESVVNNNSALSIYGFWIYNLCYKNLIPLVKYPLGLICSSSDVD